MLSSNANSSATAGRLRRRCRRQCYCVAFLASPLGGERIKVRGLRTANAFELALDKTLTLPSPFQRERAPKRACSSPTGLNIPTDN
jgi:hypothetical protein